MKGEHHDLPLAARRNGWVSCGIGSGSTKGVLIYRCARCAWEAEITAWKPRACPRCDTPFEEKQE